MNQSPLSLRELYPDAVLADWAPELIPKGLNRVRLPELGGSYDAWFGECDSVLLSLAEEAGLKECDPEPRGYLALRFDPGDAPFAAAAIQRAQARQVTVYGARRISLSCSALRCDVPWGFRIKADAATGTATEFRSGICEDRGQLLVVVFAGPKDFSDGCVTWAGFVRTDHYDLW